MADLAPSAVSLYPTSLAESEYYSSKKGTITRRIKLTNVSQGGATNRLTAGGLGFKKLVACGSLFDTTNGKIIAATVDPVNNIILLGAGAAGVVGDLAGVTGYITVTGY